MIEPTRDCGGGRWERGWEMEIVVKGITKKPYFHCVRTRLRYSWLYLGGPVRMCLVMKMTKEKKNKIERNNRGEKKLTKSGAGLC